MTEDELKTGLPDSERRCRGVFRYGLCQKRDTCKRYNYRDTGGESAKTDVVLCNAFWCFYIPMGKADHAV